MRHSIRRVASCLVLTMAANEISCAKASLSGNKSSDTSNYVQSASSRGIGRHRRVEDANVLIDIDGDEDASDSNTTNTTSNAPEAEECPPAVVSSYEEIAHYSKCRKSRPSRVGTHYACESVGDNMIFQTNCEGVIDDSIVTPACSKNITSCDDTDFYSVCEKPSDEDASAYVSDNCGASTYPRDVPNEFACWDKEADQWCRGYIEPTKGTFEDPVCPTKEIRSIGELESYGISSQLQCTSNIVTGEIYYECQRDTQEGAKEVWCQGFISSMNSFCESDAKDTRGHPSCHNTNLRCPPPVVSSYDIVEAFCSIAHEHYAVMEKLYICKEHDNDEISCRGLIDVAATPPIACTSNITSCPDYNELEGDKDSTTSSSSSSVSTLSSVCDRSIASPFDSVFLAKYCNNRASESSQGSVGTFQCWDNIQQEYCLGHVSPPGGNNDDSSGENETNSEDKDSGETEVEEEESYHSAENSEDANIYDTAEHEDDESKKEEEEEMSAATIDYATENDRTPDNKKKSSGFPFWFFVCIVGVAWYMRRRSQHHYGFGDVGGQGGWNQRNYSEYTHVGSAHMEMT
jgi:hypothetical protein